MYLSENDAVKKIKQFFDQQKDSQFVYITQKRTVVTCKMLDNQAGGIEVDNLSNNNHKNFLPWSVFWSAVHILHICGGEAEKGNAMTSRLGSPGLSFVSVEGHVAHVVYGAQSGESVFKRISPIEKILKESGVCVNSRGSKLKLKYYP